MNTEKEHMKDCKRMGIALLGLASAFSLTAYFLPTVEASLWLNSNNKEGVYVLSCFFLFLSLYCFGASRRRNNSHC